MKASEEMYRSPLDKPLRELTEEDISHVTREDCRRYLKEKGMRRPSWNKSQAIQQVLSLKSLFETWPKKQESSSRKSPSIVSHGPCRLDSAVVGRTNLSEGSPCGGEERPPVQTDLEALAMTPETSAQQLPVFWPSVADSHSNRSAYGAGLSEPAAIAPGPTTMEGAAAQMTIFYGGIVNVYDNVSPEKARFVMLLAQSPNFMGHVMANSHPSAFPARRSRQSSPPPTALSPSDASPPTDGPITRIGSAVLREAEGAGTAEGRVRAAEADARTGVLPVSPNPGFCYLYEMRNRRYMLTHQSGSALDS